MPLDAEQQAWIAAGPRELRLSPAACLNDGDAIVRALGYGAGRTIPAHLRNDLDRLHTRALELATPRICWVPVAVTLGDDAVICTAPASGRLAVGGMVHAQLHRSVAAVVFVVTIGDALERAARALLAGPDAVGGFVLDALGSVAAEGCADALEGEVRRAVAPLGWAITNRFSPGYCTWDTADQAALFALLPERPAGVGLSPSALMQPIKSISGIIGLGPDVRYEAYPCAFCQMETCHQRLVDARH